MDAACDVCGDKHVTSNNPIFICKRCHVAVHKKCYKIKNMPGEDWFCNVCQHMDDKRKDITLIKPVPVSCQLCPMKNGAFVRTEDPNQLTPEKDNIVENSLWTHVLCAQWQGLKYVDISHETVESVQDLKASFLKRHAKCCLCGERNGAYNKCHEDCDQYMHISCARASGLCHMTHGENSRGVVQSDEAWRVYCPDHSNPLAKSVTNNCSHAKQRSLKSKPFDALNKKERDLFFQDSKHEAEFLALLMDRTEGARCEICYARDDIDLKRCNFCRVVLHPGCYLTLETGKRSNQKNLLNFSHKAFTCDACKYLQEYDYQKGLPEAPSCHMCNQKGGALKHAFALPASMKRWKNKKEYEESLFGKDIWCHMLCGMWNTQCSLVDDKFNCSQIILTDGISHLCPKVECCLCGRKDKIKIACDGGENGSCQGINEHSTKPVRFHLTCARQAGFEVDDYIEPDTEDLFFSIKCYQHKSNAHAIRAQLEDFIELEKLRIGKGFEDINKPMSTDHAAKLLHWAISILQIFGWAWRWAEWWVEVGDTWEPLLEEGGEEQNMTKEQLGIVASTKKSRCEDARRCRLAPFGAALRNRSYDAEENGGRKELSNALRAIFHTPSLVGPLKQYEIEFYVEWLGRAYRSKSPLLGFGVDKIPCASSGECLQMIDGSPKFELGNRSLPGKTQSDGEIFEDIGKEVGKFLRKSYDSIDAAPKSEQSKKNKSKENMDNPILSVGTPVRRRKGKLENLAIFEDWMGKPVEIMSGRSRSGTRKRQRYGASTSRVRNIRRRSSDVTKSYCEPNSDGEDIL